MLKKRIIKHLIIIFSLILICNSLSYFATASDEVIPDKDLIPVCDYVLVCMEHEYSFPDKDYEPSYFGEEYVEKVKAIYTYEEGGLANKEDFCRIEKLYLTDFGKEKIDQFLEYLNARVDILSAERDYKSTNAYLEVSNEDSEIPADATPIYDYILVTLDHKYSFPEKDYEPSYFGEKYVNSVKAIYTYEEGCLADREDFCRIEKLYLTEFGRDNIDLFIDQLNTRNDILYAEKDYLCKNCYSLVTPNDPLFPSYQYGLQKTMCQKAWAITNGSVTMRIGVVDSGIQSTHTDLATNVNTTLSINCVDGETDLNDIVGHGTMVAGVASAGGNNNIGICGVSWYSSLINLRVGSAPSGDISNDSVINAVNYANNNSISILNMSIGNLTYDNALKTAIQGYGGICVVAAGNSGNTSLPYPAKYNTSNMITVAATDQNDNLISISNYHSSKVHLAAPGYQIWTTNSSGAYSRADGTSLAAPYVAGTLALMRSANINLSPSQLKSIVLNSVDQLNGLSGKVSTGGRLNTFRAVRKAKGYLMGDADLNGSVTASDARKVLRWAAQLDSYTDLNEALCDVNYSDTITSADAQLILQVASHTIPPIE